MSRISNRIALLFILLTALSVFVLRPATPPADQSPRKVAPALRGPLLTAVAAQEQLDIQPPRIIAQLPEKPVARPATLDTTTPAQPAATEQPSWPRTRKMRMLVTAYCPCRKCCGRFADGKTASGKSVYTNGSMFVAADTKVVPMGMMLSVPGYHAGLPVPVLDRGRVIKGNRLDVFFMSHQRAARWGARWLDVTVYLGE